MSAIDKIRKLFVLMLENRSYDNILGWSDLRGWTPDGQPTHADGLIGKPPFSNVDGNGTLHTVAAGASFRLNSDPGHEFSDVLLQLCGSQAGITAEQCLNDSASLPGNGSYPALAATAQQAGFARCLSAHQQDVASAMRGFSPEQLPVLNFLAHQFAVCDRWFSSVPGPTWPNRFFALAATSWGLDHSPSTNRILASDIFDGEKFGTGSDSLLTRLNPAEWLVAFGDPPPQAWALKGVNEDARKWRFIEHDTLLQRLQDGKLDDERFIFIEPRYDALGNFRNGESMHPVGDVRNGEALVKRIYEAIKSSRYWNESALLIVFDEHGGFFDHVLPDPRSVNGLPTLQAQPPGPLNMHNFRFDQFGLRVPAIIVSPYIRQATIDHDCYDHAAIARTLAQIARPGSSQPLLDTPRYAVANSFARVFTLSQPRASSDIPPCPEPLPCSNGYSTGGSRTAQAFNNLNWPGQ
ncbi:alkaline phosphatase family protein [Aquitalea aquatilis]|uniref:alkaline phosphatase family protein n=1 Tax=Aquitalea aquatilis TaxID=1537400 RepID=UPI00196B28E2|nr:alkaline phosphatase family protein [Aquitalea aquatilis]